MKEFAIHIHLEISPYSYWDSSLNIYALFMPAKVNNYKAIQASNKSILLHFKFNNRL